MNAVEWAWLGGVVWVALAISVSLILGRIIRARDTQKVTVTRASATFTPAAGDPEVYDSAVGVTITCPDLA